MKTSMPRIASLLARWCVSRDIASALAVLAMALAGCAAPQLSQEAPAGLAASVPTPTISTGDSWTYRVYDGFTGLPRADQRHEVTRADGGRIEVAGNVERGDGSQVYDREWNWLKRPATDLHTFEYSPAYPAFAFPLTAGKRWSSRVTATDPRDGRRFPVRLEGRVLGWERVKVPAGAFDALKIERRVYIGYWEQGVRGDSVILEYEWYAPSVKWAVKREARATFLTYVGSIPHDYGFRRVDDATSWNPPHYIQDDWLIYELTTFKVR